jgi:hypothetical protein
MKRRICRRRHRQLAATIFACWKPRSGSDSRSGPQPSAESRVWPPLLSGCLNVLPRSSGFQAIRKVVTIRAISGFIGKPARTTSR